MRGQMSMTKQIVSVEYQIEKLKEQLHDAVECINFYSALMIGIQHNITQLEKLQVEQNAKESGKTNE